MISISLSKVCSHYWSIFSYKCDFLSSQKNDIYYFFKFAKIYEDLLICKAKSSLNSLKLKVYEESEAKRSFPPVIEFKKISWSWQGYCRWCKNSNLMNVNLKNVNDVIHNCRFLYHHSELLLMTCKSLNFHRFTLIIEFYSQNFDCWY